MSAKRHKHADLIHAWAEGAEIEYHSDLHGRWVSVIDNNPLWSTDTEYRIKPEKKPDVVKKFTLESHPLAGMRLSEVPVAHESHVQLTFSGETGKLIKAEVL